MATGNYKNGAAIVVTYQAVNSATGKTVTMSVYDETHALDAVKSIAAMTEIGTTGRYYATFTPDAEGEWILIMKNTTDNNGEVVKAYSVSGHDVDSVGDVVDTIDGKADTIVSAVGGIATIDGKADTIVSAVGGIATIDGKADTIISGLSALASPAMVG